MLATGKCFGAPTHLDVGRAPGEEGSATLTLTLDQAARAKGGFNFAWLNGPLSIKLKAPLNRTSADVEIDLTQAAIDNPATGRLEGRQQARQGHVPDQTSASEGAALGNLAVEFGTVLVRGAADIGPDGSILAAKVTQARISPGDDLRADVVNSANVVKASVRGSSLDARPFIKSLTEQASPSQAGGKDFDIDMKIASVLGANKQSIAGLELNFVRRDGADRLVMLRGRVGQGSVGASRGGDGESAPDFDRRGRSGEIRRPLRADGGRRSRPAVADRRRDERRCGDGDEFRPSRRTGIPPTRSRGACGLRATRSTRPSPASRR